MPAFLAPVVGAIAPRLAQKGFDLLGGLFSSAADKGVGITEGVIKDQIEKVANLIEEKTGIPIDDIAEDKLTEEQWLKLREFELQEHETLLEAQHRIAEVELEREKAILADRHSARTAGTARDDNDDPYIRRFTYHYAYLITLLTFMFILVAVFLPAWKGVTLPKESWQIINTVVGFLLGVGLSAVIQYFYGSSMGSKNKEKIISQQQKGGDRS